MKIHKEDQTVLEARDHKCIWLYGPSGTGKTTTAQALLKYYPTGIILDGDDLRNGLNSNLNFSYEDKKENSRRVAEVAKLLIPNHTVICSIITPYQKFRKIVKTIIPEAYMVYLKSNMETRIARDPKGLYKKLPYYEFYFEESEDYDLILDTNTSTVEENILKII